MEHLPGLLKPRTDQLSSRCIGDSDCRAVFTGGQDQVSQQVLFPWLGRDTQCTVELAAVLAWWAVTRLVESVWFASVQEGGEIPSTRHKGGTVFPQCSSIIVALAGLELALGTGQSFLSAVLKTGHLPGPKGSKSQRQV